MCELLVRVRDKRNEDPVADAKRFQAGYVVDVKEDGAEWGREEYLNPDWCFIFVYDVPAESCMDLMGRQFPSEPGVDRMLQRRAFRLDIVKLGVDPSCPDRWDYHFTLAEIRAAKVPTDVLDDPLEAR